MKRFLLQFLSAVPYSLLLSCEGATAYPSFSEMISGRNLSRQDEWTQLGSPFAQTFEELNGVGYSIASSYDGKIVAVGSPFADNHIGHVEVFKYDEDFQKWVLMGIPPKIDLYHRNFGADVALSYNGDVLVVASPNSLEGRGAVTVYRFDSFLGHWEQIGDDIEGKQSREEFGSSIAVTEDGDMIAIGAPKATGVPGAIRVYEFVGSDTTGKEWMQVGSDIVGELNNDMTGETVDILEYQDEYFVAVGAPMDLFSEGSAAVYKFDNDLNDWEQFGVRVDGDEYGTDFGLSVSLGHDGTNLILAVGFPGPGIDENSAIKSGVQSYSIAPDGTWDYYGQMIFPREEGDQTGFKVSLSRDGQTLAIGSPKYGNAGNGLVQVYYKGEDSEVYVPMGDGVVGDEYDGIGFSLALSRDGKIVAFGTPENEYVSSYVLGTSDAFLAKSVSPMEIVLVIFFSIVIIALVVIGTAGVVHWARNRGASFSSIPMESDYDNNQMMAMPVTRRAQQGADSDGDDDDEDDDDISYNDGDMDYETHLRTII